jgi:hypothetical protein
VPNDVTSSAGGWDNENVSTKTYKPEFSIPGMQWASGAALELPPSQSIWAPRWEVPFRSEHPQLIRRLFPFMMQLEDFQATDPVSMSLCNPFYKKI